MVSLPARIATRSSKPMRSLSDQNRSAWGKLTSTALLLLRIRRFFLLRCRWWRCGPCRWRRRRRALLLPLVELLLLLLFLLLVSLLYRRRRPHQWMLCWRGLRVRLRRPGVWLHAVFRLLHVPVLGLLRVPIFRLGRSLLFIDARRGLHRPHRIVPVVRRSIVQRNVQRRAIRRRTMCRSIVCRRIIRRRVIRRRKRTETLRRLLRPRHRSRLIRTGRWFGTNQVLWRHVTARG
jgi:hypothetical protein